MPKWSRELLFHAQGFYNILLGKPSFCPRRKICSCLSSSQALGMSILGVSSGVKFDVAFYLELSAFLWHWILGRWIIPTPFSPSLLLAREIYFVTSESVQSVEPVLWNLDKYFGVHVLGYNAFLLHYDRYLRLVHTCRLIPMTTSNGDLLIWIVFHSYFHMPRCYLRCFSIFHVMSSQTVFFSCLQ